MSRLSRTFIAAVVAVGAVLGVAQITSGSTNSTKESVFVGIVPTRLLDTRENATTFDSFDQAAERLDAGTTYELDIAGRAGIPTDALSVTANLVAVNPSGPGHLTVYPCGFDKPLASALNYMPGVNNANEFSAKHEVQNTYTQERARQSNSRPKHVALSHDNHSKSKRHR